MQIFTGTPSFFAYYDTKNRSSILVRVANFKQLNSVKVKDFRIGEAPLVKVTSRQK